MCSFKDDEPIQMIPRTELDPDTVVSALGYVEDYNHSLINIPAMWRHTKGQGVKVAVLDSGMPRHKDIPVAGSFTFICGYHNDKCGHATSVGSLIGGKCPSGTLGITGVAPECEMYFGTVLNASGAGSLTSIAKGIRWAVDEVHADIINLSLGTPHAYGCDQKVKDACDYAYEHGSTLIAAAGNDASDVNWPAALENVIAVAAVDRNLKTASFSARGPEVEFAAGGVDVMAAYRGGSYATVSGTSFSAPVVSGIAALIISEHLARGEKPTPEEVRQHLKEIAYDIGEEGRDDETGWGIPVFTKDTENAMGKPGTPKTGSWLSRVFKSLKFW